MTTGRINQVTIICLLRSAGKKCSKTRPRAPPCLRARNSKQEFFTDSLFCETVWLLKVNARLTQVFFSPSTSLIVPTSKVTAECRVFYHPALCCYSFGGLVLFLRYWIKQSTAEWCHVVLPRGLLSQNGWCSPLPRMKAVQRERNRSSQLPKLPTPNVPSEPGFVSMIYAARTHTDSFHLQQPKPSKLSECLLAKPMKAVCGTWQPTRTT